MENKSCVLSGRVTTHFSHLGQLFIALIFSYFPRMIKIDVRPVGYSCCHGRMHRTTGRRKPITPLGYKQNCLRMHQRLVHHHRPLDTPRTVVGKWASIRIIHVCYEFMRFRVRLLSLRIRVPPPPAKGLYFFLPYIKTTNQLFFHSTFLLSTA